MTEWYTYTVFDDRLEGCTTYDKNGNPIPHRHGFVYYGKQPKSPNELNDILENLVKMRRETKAINEIVGSLRNMGFKVDAVPKPDQEHFGNWVLLAYRTPLAIRVISDRGEVDGLFTFQSGCCH